MSNYNLFMDGDMWCATLPNFKNIQESPAGFGITPDKATIALLEVAYSKLRLSALSMDTGNSGSCGDCGYNSDLEDEIEAEFPELSK